MRPEIYECFKELVVRYKPSASVIEIGGLNVNGSVRDLFPLPYLSTDMRVGIGVDRVLDITDNINTDIKYNTIVCCETLEHVNKPWVAAENIFKLMSPGALLFVSVPFKHGFHAYPNDYYRYTPSGLKVLFDKLQWLETILLGDQEFPDTVICIFRKSEL